MNKSTIVKLALGIASAIGGSVPQWLEDSAHN